MSDPYTEFVMVLAPILGGIEQNYLFQFSCKMSYNNYLKLFSKAGVRVKQIFYISCSVMFYFSTLKESKTNAKCIYIFERYFLFFIIYLFICFFWLTTATFS